jgi:valyl-tRNA synthetase
MLLKILHPFMPFITEEIYHLLSQRSANDCIVIAQWPMIKEMDKKLLADFEQTKNIISQIRNIRNEKNMSPKIAVELTFKGENNIAFVDAIKKLANVTAVVQTKITREKAYSFIEGTTEFFIPFNESMDVEAERLRVQKELEYNKGFLESVMKKLSNQSFVSKAKPEIISAEEKKKADAEQKIKALNDQLDHLT